MHVPGPALGGGPQSVKSEAMSRSDSGDGTALPTSANWAKNPQVEQSRRSSQAASRATPSPKASNAKVAVSTKSESTTVQPSVSTIKTIPTVTTPREPKQKGAPKPQAAKPPAPACQLTRALRMVKLEDLAWTLDRGLVDESILEATAKMPPMIDAEGGAIRFAKQQQDLERQKREEEDGPVQAALPAEEDEILASGSLQLGGEPETAEDGKDSAHADRARGFAGHDVPKGYSGQGSQYETQNSLISDLSMMGLNERSMTPQQQRNLSLLRSNHQRQDSSVFEQFQRGPSGNTSQHQSQLSNPFQNQNQQLSAMARHGRHASRYTFANDTPSASTNVKPNANAQLLAQQSAMMPPNQQKPFSGHSQVPPNLQTSFYSGVQGPPPGLKSSGTPPVSGGGMFGQGHGFASAMGGSAGVGFGNTGKGNHEDLLRDIIRNRSGAGNNTSLESAKSESAPPALNATGAFDAPGPSSTASTPLDHNLLNHLALHPSRPYNSVRRNRKRRGHAVQPSFGGGGADMSDPSIVQPRMHLGGVGQGQYSGNQTQGGYNAHPMMYGGGGGGFGSRWS